MGQNIQKWTKKNLWKTAFKKFDFGMLPMPKWVTDHIPLNFLKAVSHKYYLLYSWKFCPIYG